LQNKVLLSQLVGISSMSQALINEKWIQYVVFYLKLSIIMQTSLTFNIAKTYAI
jgi:hypothetical protein